MEEIFDLVAEYPDSHVAVLELRTVLERTKMHHTLGKALKKSLVRRLNHPGANTSQIIDVYINTIKVRSAPNKKWGLCGKNSYGPQDYRMFQLPICKGPS